MSRAFYCHFADAKSARRGRARRLGAIAHPAVITEIETSSDEPLQQLRLLFRRVTALD